MLFKVSAAVLQTLRCLGISNEDAVLYFVSCYERAKVCPPNYKMYGKALDVWIVRDFYPGTKLLFKLVIRPSGSRDEFDPTIIVKVSMVDPMGHKVKNTHIRPDLNAVKKYIEQQTEFALLGSDKKPDTFLSLEDRKIVDRPPKRMFPKGYNK